MRTTSSRLGSLALGCALMFFSANAPAEATTITSVVVTSNGVTYNAGSVGWSFPITLLPGQDLVLSQDFQGAPNTTTSYNFDTSDNPTGAAPTSPQISITADGITTVFTDALQVLNVKNQGSVDLSFDEAQNYGIGLVGPGYQVFLGYADNVHPGVCGAYANSLGLLGSATCFPSPFSGATFFEGRGALIPPDPIFIEPLDGIHCVAGTATCYDAGVIRIVGAANPAAVPEPATMALLLTGLTGLTARRHGQARRRARDKN